MIDREKTLLGNYRIVGHFGNNTTIPADERCMIAGLTADCKSSQADRLRLAGEQSMVLLSREYGLVPQGATWTDFTGIILSSERPNKWELALSQQYSIYEGRLSKSPRNIEKVRNLKEGAAKK